MLDPAAHCPGTSYSCWELLGHKNASAHALLTQSCFKGCQKSVGKNILYHPKIPFKKSLVFWRRQPPQLLCIAILVSWYHLLNNCVCCYSCHLVSTVLPGPLGGLEFSWPGIWCRSTFTVPHSPSGLWPFQVVSCLVSTFCSRQDAADSLLCDRWSSLGWVLCSSAVLQALWDQGKGHYLIKSLSPFTLSDLP